MLTEVGHPVTVRAKGKHVPQTILTVLRQRDNMVYLKVGHPGTSQEWGFTQTVFAPSGCPLLGSIHDASVTEEYLGEREIIGYPAFARLNDRGWFTN